MAINAKLQTLINIKNDIGTAITNKGGTITAETPFFNYASEIDNISTGTPQTVFQDSTGAKWARTNVVNLTNVSNNVTSDFNWWQSANGATSDPILTGGTVGANISGNIRIVPINQVYGNEITNIVITDTAGAKYVAYNGYDSVTNPNAPNTVNGTNIVGTNEANMSLLLISNETTGNISDLKTNNGFIYAGVWNVSAGWSRVYKYNETNMAYVTQATDSIIGAASSLFVNNGFVYFARESDRRVCKYHESNLAFVGNTVSYGGEPWSIFVNNGFLYVGGVTTQTVRKYHEGNLVFVGNTPSYGGHITNIAINNENIYVVGYQDKTIKKYNEATLSFISNSATFVFADHYRPSLQVKNNFVYVGGYERHTVGKYHESNFTFIGNTANIGNEGIFMAVNNGFIYASSNNYATGDRLVVKYRDDNFAYVGQTAPMNTGSVNAIHINNNFLFTGSTGGNFVRKYQESQTLLEQLPSYTFNRWLLNNSASGTAVFANITITNGGTFNGPNVTRNESNIAQNAVSSFTFPGPIRAMAMTNGFIYAGGESNQSVRRIHESNLVISANSATYGGDVMAIAINNGFIYVGGNSNFTIQKFEESNFSRVGNTISYGGDISSVRVNNGFVYAAGSIGGFPGNGSQVKKYHESNLALFGNSANYGGFIYSFAINNGFIYAGGGFSNQGVHKYHESNLAFVGNTAGYGGEIYAVVVNNGFIYAGGGTQTLVQKFHESNLARVENSANFGGQIRTLTSNNGFIYAGGYTNLTVQKFYESNLVRLVSTSPIFQSGGTENLATNNNFFYVAIRSAQKIYKFQEAQLIPESLTFYTATKIKEDI